MKRLVLFLVIVAAAAFATFYAVRHNAPVSHAAVAALLPSETIALVHVSDLNRTRDQWHESDIYKLYREPAVQDFLQKPLAQIPNRDANSQTLRASEQLQIKDGFVALTSIENNNPIVLGGFRFRGTREQAQKFAEGFLPGKVTDYKAVDYREYKIDVATFGPNSIATAVKDDWFLIAATFYDWGSDQRNLTQPNLDQIKTLLDRADHRLTNAQDQPGTLEQEEHFRAATAHMPGDYAALFYLQPKYFGAKLASLRSQATSSNQRTMLEQISSICAAVRFDGRKIHDIWFVGMPLQEQNAKLTRSAAELGTSDTFLYLATLLNLEKLAGLNQPGSTAPVAVWLQKGFDVASRNGITIDDWKAGFDLELGSLADWPATAHWPSVIAALPVKDPVRANKIVNALTSAIDEDGDWKKIDKDGIHFFVLQTPASLLAVAPTIALSDKLLVAGADSASVEAAIKHGGSGLIRSDTYKTAVRTLPKPTNFFAYVDLPLLYARLDASLRPMLIMAAAFMPAMSERVDLAKLPPAEVVTRHLSPIVSSQRYDRDGYVAESVGSITLTQFGCTVALPAILWWNSQHHRR